ncbi:MAG: hypothetical protein AAF253_08380 [Pseudomonadota bacterium]
MLVYSLIGLREHAQRLEARGATHWEVRLTGWGQAYIAKVYWPDAPADWRDTLYRTVLGEPVPDPQPEPQRPTLGIVTNDGQTQWALANLGAMEGVARHTPSLRETCASGRCQPSPSLAQPVAEPARAPP